MAKVVESLPWLKETHLNFYYVSTLRKPKVNHGFFVIFYVIGISVTLPRCSISSDTSLLAVDGALPDRCTYFIDWSFIASYYPATARLADLSLKVSGSCQCNFGGILRHYADTPHLMSLPHLLLTALRPIYAHVSLTFTFTASCYPSFAQLTDSSSKVGGSCQRDFGDCSKVARDHG
ncbi:hypothetical protein ACOSQ4_012701 [Xanthoceras sorbifolium]